MAGRKKEEIIGEKWARIRIKVRGKKEGKTKIRNEKEEEGTKGELEVTRRKEEKEIRQKEKEKEMITKIEEQKETEM